MSKPRRKFHFRIPPYKGPRNEWRKRIHAAATEMRGNVRYAPDDRLEVEVVFYFVRGALDWHDVDNRLKDVLDALQGRAGGSKADQSMEPIIPNDRQIYRVIVEKREPPGQSRGYGHVTIRSLRPKARS